ncbi:class I lanthipeptide [Aquimarina sp. U1-2]|uniref:class I lanthipeptide n=1 Tax=Aquimarina sp. U1-2 TaxID=2823141 RepID=UPI001AECB031|nr:class I lanthipeptide [Aquimarina sp. U1-2]MBP2833389.1 class I lanthipeptide [Aquimarina sp. U1-2]
MKTQNVENKLKFSKNSISELNQDQMMSINGGSTIIGGETCSGCVCMPTINTITVIK